MLLRIHFLQQWFSLSDEGVEDALHDVPVYRAFVGGDPGATGIPDATAVFRFPHLLEAHGLATGFLSTINAVLEAMGLLLSWGTALDATIVAAPSSTKNRHGSRSSTTGRNPSQGRTQRSRFLRTPPGPTRQRSGPKPLKSTLQSMPS